MSHKVTRFTVPCQEWIKIDPIVAQEIKENPEEYFSQCRDPERRLLNYLLFLHSTCGVVYPTVSKIAREAGITREHAHRLLRKMKEDGILATNYRHMRSSLYRTSSFFSGEDIRKRLQPYFSALKIIPLVFLLSTVQRLTANFIKPRQSEYVTGLGLKKEIYKSPSSHATNVPTSVGDILSQIANKMGKKRIIPGKRMEIDRRTTPSADRDLIEPEVLKITEPSLTKWGQIRLCAFNAPTISHARLNYDKTLKGQAAYHSLFREALLHCRRNNIEPDFRRIQYLGERFNMPDNPALVITDRKIEPPPPKKPYSQRVEPKRIPPQRANVAEQNKEQHRRPERLEYKAPDLSKFDPEEVYDRYEHAKETSAQLRANLEKLGLPPDWNPMNGEINNT